MTQIDLTPQSRAGIGLGALLAVLSFVALLPVPALSKLDLDRQEPVPANQVIPVEDFFRPAMFEQPKLNPSGTHVAALTSGGFEKKQLMVHDLSTGQAELVGDIGGMDVTGFDWLDDGRITFSCNSATTRQGFNLVVKLENLSSPYALFQNGGFSIVGIPMDDRQRPLAWASYGQVTDPLGEVAAMDTDVVNHTIIELSRTNDSTQAREKIERQNSRAMLQRYPFLDFGVGHSYGSDGFGNLAHATVWRNGLQELHRWDGDGWQPVGVDLEALDLFGAGTTGDEVVASELLYDGNPSALRILDLKTGQLGMELLRDKGYDFNGWVVRDPGTRSIVGLDFERSMPTFVWFDDGYRQLHETFKASFPKQVVRIVSVNETADTFVLQVYNDRHPPSYHIANIKERTMGPLKTARPWLDNDRLSRGSIFKYSTAEGHKMDVYITLPKGVSKENPAPMVVLPHNGPGTGLGWTRTRLGYHDVAQFLASRGYVVLRPNYRGSPGYNWKFPEADQWDYLKMADDVIRATRTALKTKLVDPSRVAIMGESFGAYLSLLSATEAPDLYKSTVLFNGFYDWSEVMRDSGYNQHSSPNHARWRLKLGDPGDSRDKYTRMSPVNHVGKLQGAVFVAQGRDNPELTRHESKRLVSALKRAKVKNESIFTDWIGYGNLDLENRVKVFTEIEGFLAKNL